jgi:hypothetical protein
MAGMPQWLDALAGVTGQDVPSGGGCKRVPIKEAADHANGAVPPLVSGFVVIVAHCKYLGLEGLGNPQASTQVDHAVG